MIGRVEPSPSKIIRRVLGGYQKYLRYHLGIFIGTSQDIILSDTLIENLIIGSHLCENRMVMMGSKQK
jgi:hypothetical protein